MARLLARAAATVHAHYQPVTITYNHLPGWTAHVRWRGLVWQASGDYNGPGVTAPERVVDDWTLTRASAIEQVQHWIEGADAEPSEWMPAPGRRRRLARPKDSDEHHPDGHPYSARGTRADH